MITLERPEVEFDQGAYPNVCDAYRHEDGSITYIVYDFDGEHANPRENDGNVATLIQENDHYIAIDEDHAGLKEARERFDCYGRHGTSAHGYAHGTKVALDREAMMRRYIAIFRPDILYYRDRWGEGDSYGWGYVDVETWRKWMYPEKPYMTENATPEEQASAAEYYLTYEPSCTPEEAFNQEVDVYGQWARGEVYGAHHVSVGEPIVTYGDQGAYVDAYKEDEESCWGFLGYDEHKDIAAQFTDSPITEVLY